MDGTKLYKYFGLTSTQFIVRYRNHKHSFSNIKLEKSTELCKFIWKLKNENTTYSIDWSIVRYAEPYKAGSKFCNLCISEAIQIAYPAGDTILINSRDGIINHCRHRDKWKLEKY